MGYNFLNNSRAQMTEVTPPTSFPSSLLSTTASLSLSALWSIAFMITTPYRGLPWWFSGKESACNAGDLGSIPGLGISPERGNGNPLQYSCLENPVDRGPRHATVQRVTNRCNWACIHSHFIEKWPFLLSSFLFFSSTNHWNICIKESESIGIYAFKNQKVTTQFWALCEW